MGKEYLESITVVDKKGELVKMNLFSENSSLLELSQIAEDKKRLTDAMNDIFIVSSSIADSSKTLSERIKDYANYPYRIWNGVKFSLSVTMHNDVPYFITKGVTDMNGLFQNQNYIKTVPILNYDEVVTASYMFEWCRELISVGDMIMPLVEDISFMFYGCTALKMPPKMYIPNVHNLTGVFADSGIEDLDIQIPENCDSLSRMCESTPNLKKATIDIKGRLSDANDAFNNSGINTLEINISNSFVGERMFSSCKKLHTIPENVAKYISDGYSAFINSGVKYLTNYVFESLTDAESMFQDTSALSEIANISAPILEKARSTFSSCYNLTSVSNISFPNATNVEDIFSSCYNLTSVSNISFPNATNVDAAFAFCNKLKNVPKIDFTKEVSLSGTFRDCGIERIPDWDYDKAIDMSGTFNRCTNLTSIKALSMAKVANNSYLLYECKSLISVESLYMPNATNIQRMFAYCSSLKRIGRLETPNVQYLSYLFYYCTSLEVVEYLDVKSVQEWTFMIFTGCPNLKYLNIVNLGVSSQSLYTFRDATSWGIGDNANRQSVINTLAINSQDRAINGLSTVTVRLSPATFGVLTDEELAIITNKGYTITIE